MTLVHKTVIYCESIDHPTYEQPSPYLYRIDDILWLANYKHWKWKKSRAALVTSCWFGQPAGWTLPIFFSFFFVDKLIKERVVTDSFNSNIQKLFQKDREFRLFYERAKRWSQLLSTIKNYPLELYISKSFDMWKNRTPQLQCICLH